MPISLRHRGSGSSKEKKFNNQSSTNSIKRSNSSDAATAEASSLNSSQSSSKDPGPDTPDDATMKSITGRSRSDHPKLDPDSSSLGPIDSTAKEAKEKSHRSSWVKTIGIRTLRLRKEHKAKQAAQGIFSTSSSSGQYGTEESAIESVVEPRANSSKSKGSAAAAAGQGKDSSSNSTNASPQNTGLESQKHVKRSSSGASKTSNGAALREAPSSSSSAAPTTAPPVSSATGNDSSTKAKANNPPAEENSDKQDPARFAGDGMSFKAKLIGILEVSGPRGDRICQEALSELKMAVKAAGEHKQKITLHVALDGLRIRDEKTGDCLYHHQVHKISFIAQDLTDARAFGYIFGSPDMGHRFFGIKTEKSASQVVIAMRDLFQVVFDLKKKEIERAKQQLEMQQKFLATRAAETAPKIEHKSSSIAETYIEGACALGNGPDSASSSSGLQHHPHHHHHLLSSHRHHHHGESGSGGGGVPEVDLLNLEVELNSLQEGLENIHNNFADHVPFRGSTASISSDPMNPKFSTSSQGGGASGGGGGLPGMSSFGGDPFGDSFDPFDTSGGGAAAAGGGGGVSFGQAQASNSSSSVLNHQSSPLSFGGMDPFAQVDPFPQPKFSNLESSDTFFNSDPFDTPVGNFSFNFPAEGNNTTSNISSTPGFSSVHENANTSGGSERFVSSSGVSLAQRSSSAMAESITGEPTAVSWKASFDDNFVPDGKSLLSSMNGPSPKQPTLDIFTELDPLGTGRVRPFVDRKDFFQDLKNPPRKMLNELYSTEMLEDDLALAGGGGGGGAAASSAAAASSSLLSTPPPSSTSPKGSSKVLLESSSDKKNTIPNSFSTNFNPVGFDSAFKSSLHASSMSKARKDLQDSQAAAQQQYQSSRTISSSSGLRDSFRFRSESPPNYNPPPPPNHSANNNNNNTNSEVTSTLTNAFTNNEYFATPTTATIISSSHSSIVKSTPPPPLLPPPGSSLAASGASPGLHHRTKKSPQLLKQMTISSGVPSAHSSSSPRTLPRSARLGKQYTVDIIPSADEMSPIPNLTPPPRPPHHHHGTLNKNVTLATAVPRPYSSDKTQNIRTTPMTSFTARTFTNSSNLAPEPPPRPLQTTMITTGGGGVVGVGVGGVGSSSGSNVLSGPPSPQVPLVSPPPLPPKKTSIGPTLSNPSTSSLSSNKHNVYTTDIKKMDSASKLENDLPLPLPSRKTSGNLSHSNSNNNNNNNSSFGGNSNNRYCIPGGGGGGTSSSSHKESRYEFPEGISNNGSHKSNHKNSDIGSNNLVPKLSMEQAIQQVASLSLGQLAARLELPVEKLSTYTIQQLAEKLTLMEVARKSASSSHLITSDTQHRSRHTAATTTTPASNFGGSSSHLGFESNFNPDFNADDISTMSAPGGYMSHSHNRASSAGTNSGPVSGGSDNNYDRYAVFRELTVEDASGFSLGNENDFSEDEDKSRTLDKTLTGRDSSSERTLQVEDEDFGGFPLSEAQGGHTASIASAMNTMDDVTDANLSDENDKFPLDDELSKSDWATFETNFDEFAPTTAAATVATAPAAVAPPPPMRSVNHVLPIKLSSTRRDQQDSPWDSDDENEKLPVQAINSSFLVDDKLLDCALPPDPEEFNFQPFEKPAPIVTPQGGRRSSRDRSAPSQGFESFELEARLPGPGQFKRQSSGSSKHSIGKNSDYSDSGRQHRTAAGEAYRSRNNSRDLDTWDGRGGGSGGGHNRDRDFDDWDRRDRDLWDREGGGGGGGGRREFVRSDSRNNYARQGSGGGGDTRRYASRDSDEEFGVSSRFSGNSRDSSLRRSGGSGSRSRVSSARVSKRDTHRSKDNLENDEEEDEVDDDDRSFASYHSGYSQSSSHHRRHHHRRQHPPKHHHSSHSVSLGGVGGGVGSGPVRRHRRSDFSPERYSNHESDFDDSYEEDNNSRRKDYYGRDQFGKQSAYAKPGRPGSGGSVNKRYERSYEPHHDSTTSSNREYYKSSREREGSNGRHRRTYRHPAAPPEAEHEEGGGREYSDYSGEENSSSTRGGRKYKGKSRGYGHNSRENNRDRPYYYTNSPSWDSESQSPDRGDGASNSGGDRRKIRWGSNYNRDRPRQSPSPLTISRQEQLLQQQQMQPGSLLPRQGSATSNSSRAGVVVGGVAPSIPARKSDTNTFRFEDDFSSKGPEDTFHSFHPSELPPINNKDPPGPNNPLGLVDHKVPPQSPFEDNFVIQLSHQTSSGPGRNNNVGILGDDHHFDSIEFKRGEDSMDHFGLPSAASNAGDIFFPAKFDVDLEVEKVEDEEEEDGEKKHILSSSSVSITPIPTPSSADIIITSSSRGSPLAMMMGGGGVGGVGGPSGGKRLESIRSEEEKMESSEDGADIIVKTEDVPDGLHVSKKLETLTQVEGEDDDEEDEEAAAGEQQQQRRQASGDHAGDSLVKSQDTNKLVREKSDWMSFDDSD